MPAHEESRRQSDYFLIKKNVPYIEAEEIIIKLLRLLFAYSTIQLLIAVNSTIWLLFANALRYSAITISLRGS